MNVVRKVGTAARLFRNLEGVPALSQRLERLLEEILVMSRRLDAAPTRDELAEASQKLVDFVRFKFDESDALRELEETQSLMGQAMRDLLGYSSIRVEIATSKPVAVDSLDHLHAWGTKRDNSKNLKFNNKLFRWIPLEKVRVLDIGCSGGGFVRTVHDAGAFAVGIEGSDYSKVRARAEWKNIPERLFTADATAPFRIYDRARGSEDQSLKFSVITAWEFIEHIEEDRLQAVFTNIDRHLGESGVVLMSVSPNDDIIDGVNLHRTVRPSGWWMERIGEFGFTHHPDVVAYFSPNNWIRYEENAPGSFHLALTRSGEPLPLGLNQAGGVR